MMAWSLETDKKPLCLVPVQPGADCRFAHKPLKVYTEGACYLYLEDSMSVPAHDLCLSVDEYIELEHASKERHEYVAGRVFAMVGASDAHNKIVGNIHRHLFDPVTDAGCHIYISDMKVWIQASESFYYPDIMISCEPFEPRAQHKSAPCLIIEVLSPSTQDVVRREKLTAYRHLASLKVYVLVYQDKQYLELYRKDDLGHWHCTVYEKESKLSIDALPTTAIELDLSKIYRGLEIR